MTEDQLVRAGPAGRGQSVDLVRYRGRHREVRQRRLLPGARRPDAGRGGGIRLRQERDRAVHHAPAVHAAWRASPAARCVTAAPTCWRSAKSRCARIRGNRISMIFQEPMTSPESAADGRPANHRNACMLHQKVAARRSHGPRHGRCCAWCRSPNRSGACANIPTSCPGGMRQRAMIAHGPGLQAGGADRRRADHRAGRHHPGADTGADRWLAAESWARPSC